ncbi:MAG: SDR family oxidoreductase [Alphaproteobacteria bacterium]|uniref:SDR family oxidoreductase n=1 Tax=Candidatus Nitrobium versatile TaxID=2884831 RepID=A0A953LWC8_9BACT|nr:SDR family oxidoreductase [Candidatus Nitrobium versatile]
MYKALFSCHEKIAVVTGGSGLLGREIVKGLSDFGAVVYAADIDKDKAKDIIASDGIGYVYLDVAYESSIKEAIDNIVQTHGRIDVFVNSAYPRTADWGLKFEQIQFESLKRNLNDHLGGYFMCCQTVAEQMKLQGSGSIINLASIYGVVGPDFSIYEGTQMTMPAAYSAIKGGIIAVTKYLATYYGKYNVRANAISPGGILDNQHTIFVENYSRKTPLGRMGLPNEITGAVIFLASEASSYVTGQNLMIDGGWTAW